MITIPTPDGVDLFAVSLGPEDAPPVVVLHGGPAAHHEYLLPAFAILADELRLILYDQRGGGRSRAAPGVDLGFDRHVEDIGHVMDHFGLRRASLMGYSFGGLLSQLFTTRHPERVDRLVLASSAPPWNGYRAHLDRALAVAQAAPIVQTERAALERSSLREILPEEYRRRRFALSVAGYFVDPRRAYGMTPFRVQARTAQAVADSLGDFDFREEVAAGLDGRRTLIVHGDKDPIDIELLRDLAKRTGARLETVPDTGHVPYVEAPETFFGIVRPFLTAP